MSGVSGRGTEANGVRPGNSSNSTHGNESADRYGHDGDPRGEDRFDDRDNQSDRSSQQSPSGLMHMRSGAQKRGPPKSKKGKGKGPATTGKKRRSRHDAPLHHDQRGRDGPGGPLAGRQPERQEPQPQADQDRGGRLSSSGPIPLVSPPSRSSAAAGGGGSSGAMSTEPRGSSATGGGGSSGIGSVEPRVTGQSEVRRYSGSPAMGRNHAEGRAHGQRPAFGRIGAPVTGTDCGENSSRSSSRRRSGKIHEDMKASEVCDVIEKVMPPSDLPGIFGHLLATMPTRYSTQIGHHLGHNQSAEAPKQTGKTGSSSERGFAAGALVVFSYAMIGVRKMDYCLDGRTESPLNHPFYALAKKMYSGTSGGSKTFMVEWKEHLFSMRSAFHSDCRKAVATVLVKYFTWTMKSLESQPRRKTISIDYLHSKVRSSLSTLDEGDVDSEEMKTFFSTVFNRPMKAHRGNKTRPKLTLEDVYGSDDLLRGFVEEVGMPLVLYAMSEIKHLKLGAAVTPRQPAPPPPLELAVLKIKEWASMKNGGYSSSNEKAFQDEMWFTIFLFTTGENRPAGEILKYNSDDLPDLDWRKLVCPYLLEDQGEPTAALDLRETASGGMAARTAASEGVAAREAPELGRAHQDHGQAERDAAVLEQEKARHEAAKKQHQIARREEPQHDDEARHEGDARCDPEEGDAIRDAEISSKCDDARKAAAQEAAGGSLARRQTETDQERRSDSVEESQRVQETLPRMEAGAEQARGDAQFRFGRSEGETSCSSEDEPARRSWQSDAGDGAKDGDDWMDDSDDDQTGEVGGRADDRERAGGAVRGTADGVEGPVGQANISPGY